MQLVPDTGAVHVDCRPSPQSFPHTQLPSQGNETYHKVPENSIPRNGFLKPAGTSAGYTLM
ncbi:MAG: hypothetical protein DRH37_09155 [Deltaproteobacteria bacterium]|nr:MAG: hypothetical protein DRH37_09155 [Deltaproteobacteria bacterium]